MAKTLVSTQPPLNITPRYFLKMMRNGLITLVVFMLVGFHGDVGALVNYLSSLSARYSHPHWPDLEPLLTASPAIQIHVSTVIAAVVLSAIQVLGEKGSRFHRLLGWGWVLLMLGTAIATLFIHQVGRGGFSFLHLFSLYVLIVTPLAVWAARRSRRNLHVKLMGSLVFGALLFAGAGAFLPGRTMWAIFFS